MIAILAGSPDRPVQGQHSRVAGNVGDFYLTVIDGVLDTALGTVPTATKRLPGILV
jgi:hypothetical protein